MVVVSLAAAMLVGGLGRRVAGGAFQQWTGVDVGDFPARAFFGLTLTAALALGGCSDVLALALATPAVFLGCAVPNFNGIAFGGEDGQSQWVKGRGLLAHGVLSMALLAGLLWWALGAPAGVAALLGSALILPCYWAGWHIAPGMGRPDLPLGLRGGSELGELFWGGAMGLAAHAGGAIT